MLYKDKMNFNNNDLLQNSRVAETKEEPMPPFLYYGTGTDFFPPRNGEDIYPECGNIYVHLYNNIAQAVSIGVTRGKPVIYLVNSKKMEEDGFVFRYSKGGLWMTEIVPAKYCEIIE